MKRYTRIYTEDITSDQIPQKLRPEKRPFEPIYIPGEENDISKKDEEKYGEDEVLDASSNGTKQFPFAGTIA